LRDVEYIMKDYVSSAIASVGLMIGTVAVYIAVWLIMAFNWAISDAESGLVANAVSATIFGITWLELWKNSIHWTRWRKVLIMLSVVWSAAVGAGIGAAVSLLTRVPDGGGWVLGGIAWWGTWIISTMLIWRESGTERATRLAGGAVHCPKCRYSLTGLREARCPECGEAFTLDALFAAQKGRDG